LSRAPGIGFSVGRLESFNIRWATGFDEPNGDIFRLCWDRRVEPIGYRALAALTLDDPLMREARKRAVREGRTLTSVLEEALSLLLTQRGPRRPYRLAWVTQRGTGTPALDVADRDALPNRLV
jgi:hypothetical protein